MNHVQVTVYTQPACQGCKATMRKLDHLAVPYRTRNVTTDPQAADTVRQLDHQQLPVVTAGDMHWSGYNPDRLDQLAAALENGSITHLDADAEAATA